MIDAVRPCDCKAILACYAGGFGNNPAFGTASAPAFSQASSSLFGAASTPAFGGNAFGGFSQTSAAAAFGSTAPAFGASSAAFGISSAATPFGFNASSAAAFGAASTPAFSFSSAAAAGTTGSSLFGQSTPAFGFGTNTGSTFGGGGACRSACKHGIRGSATWCSYFSTVLLAGIFGANKPAFGAATPAFGAGGASFAASSPSLFGTPAQQPAGGAAGFSNLFAGGGAQTSPMFNFATPGQGQAFVTAQPTQAPGMYLNKWMLWKDSLRLLRGSCSSYRCTTHRRGDKSLWYPPSSAAGGTKPGRA